jgi:cell division protein FtsB
MTLAEELRRNAQITAVHIFLCIFIAGIALYAYIEKQNELIELRLKIPALAKELRQMQEENTRLNYEIDRFESPIHLMELARKPEFSHLKYPHLDEVVILPASTALPVEGHR